MVSWSCDGVYCWPFSLPEPRFLCPDHFSFTLIHWSTSSRSRDHLITPSLHPGLQWALHAWFWVFQWFLTFEGFLFPQLSYAFMKLIYFYSSYFWCSLPGIFWTSRLLITWNERSFSVQKSYPTEVPYFYNRERRMQIWGLWSLTSTRWLTGEGLPLQVQWDRGVNWATWNSTLFKSMSAWITCHLLAVIVSFDTCVTLADSLTSEVLSVVWG